MATHCSKMVTYLASASSHPDEHIVPHSSAAGSYTMNVPAYWSGPPNNHTPGPLLAGNVNRNYII